MVVVAAVKTSTPYPEVLHGRASLEGGVGGSYDVRGSYSIDVILLTDSCFGRFSSDPIPGPSHVLVTSQCPMRSLRPLALTLQAR